MLASGPVLLKMTSQNPSQTEAIAARIYQEYLYKYCNVLLLLSGELGIGKTCFVRFLAKHVGINGTIKSPSFNLLNIYSSKAYDFYHYDLYRLRDPGELDHLDFIERWSSFPDTNKRAIHVVEWPEIALDYFPGHVPIYRLIMKWEDVIGIKDVRKLQLYGKR